ncbi:hypothetical protein Pcinc_042467 [Petrolisthes cinctipes]|uniref:Uncharacterized protein n=1 Tax=Petrolisthes cinctipes TaxID=88211 RepID=A0AAE1BID7_PETCI|nr:hypothetical protein Pcinc_042467 [Petrolisthes cinctipes]
MAESCEVVNSMLGDPSLLWPDLSFSRMLGVEEGKLLVLVGTDHGCDVAGEILATAHIRGVADNTRVKMIPCHHTLPHRVRVRWSVVVLGWWWWRL